jgi:hypothetical protein
LWNLASFFLLSRGRRALPFEGWNAERKLALSKKFIGLIQKYAIAKVSVSLDMKAYNIIFPDILRARLGNAYHFVLRWAINETLKFSSERLKFVGKVNFVFEKQLSFFARAQRIFKSGYENSPNLEADWRERPGTIAFGEKALPALPGGRHSGL